MEQLEANSIGGAHGHESPRHDHRALPHSLACLSYLSLSRMPMPPRLRHFRSSRGDNRIASNYRNDLVPIQKHLGREVI